MHRFGSLGCQFIVIGSVCAKLVLGVALLAGEPVVSSGPVGADGAIQDNQTWDVFFIRGSRVGYGRTDWKEIDKGGRKVVHWTSTNHLTLKRFGQTVQQTLKLVSFESPEGRLIGFRTELAQGAVPVTTVGTVRGNAILLETSTAGKRQSSQTTWDPKWLGFFAAEQILVRQPMQPGQTQSYKAFMPVFNHVAEVRLDAVGYESTELLAGTYELMRVTSTVKLSDKVDIQSIMWVDRSGRTLKSLVPALEQYGYRVTKEIALQQTGEGDFDLGQFSTVRLGRALVNPHRTQKIVYRVQLKEGDPSSIFVTGLSQSVAAIDAQTARITVKAIRPGLLPVNSAHVIVKPVKADVEPNNLIQSDDEQIVRMANQVATDLTKPWDIARTMERYVREQIQVKDFSHAFATAAEVAETLEGDCTEHAVLLAALCRARGIPARVAMGLVYYAQERGFAYHMWNEVWVHDRWIPLDATLGNGGIGAAHLKLGDSNLDGATSYTAFLPVIQVLGQLSIEIEAVE